MTQHLWSIHCIHFTWWYGCLRAYLGIRLIFAVSYKLQWFIQDFMEMNYSVREGWESLVTLLRSRPRGSLPLQFSSLFLFRDCDPISWCLYFIFWSRCTGCLDSTSDIVEYHISQHFCDIRQIIATFVQWKIFVINRWRKPSMAGKTNCFSTSALRNLAT